MNENGTTIWEDPRLADRLDYYLANPDDHDTAVAMIPSLFGISDKATYLGFRALGFTPRQSMEIIGLGLDELEYWSNTDLEFMKFELEYLPELQRNASSEIIRLAFLKNMALFVAKDSMIVRKSLINMNGLSKREWEYLQQVRKHYTPNDLLAMEKAMNPEKYRENQVIVLNWGDQQVQQEIQNDVRMIEG